jgi:hypothetical protein
MELNFTEIDSNKKRVTFEFEGDNDDGAEDVMTFDAAPTNNTQLPPSQQNVKYNNPNVGRFQTINRQMPVPTRINAPIDTTTIAQTPPVQPIKKKQVSYDDILSSMSMRIGPDGKLQMHSQKLVEDKIQKQQQQQQQQRQQYLPRQQQQVQVQEQIEPRQPLTKKQYQQLVVLDLIRRQQEYQRLRQIKSTKLMFPNPNVQIVTAANNSAHLNRLFRVNN